MAFDNRKKFRPEPEPTLVIYVSEHMLRRLKSLVRSGFYGATPAQAARRILECELEKSPATTPLPSPSKPKYRSN